MVSHLWSPRLYLLDQKHSKNCIIVNIITIKITIFYFNIWQSSAILVSLRNLVLFRF